MSAEVDNVPTALTPNAFTRSGYSFSGWNTAANGLGSSYADGASYPFTASVTLYAQWTANGARATTKTALKLSATKVTYGDEQTERLSVTVSTHYPGTTPSGRVTITQSGSSLCLITLSSGKGSCTLSAKRLNAGTYPLVATYQGSVDFDGSTSAKETLKATTA